MRCASGAGKASGREGLVERAGGVGGQIVLHDPDARGIGVVYIDELAQPFRVVLRRTLLGHAHLAPRPVRINGHEQVHGATAAVLVAVPQSHWKSTTVTAALHASGITAPWLLDGAMNG